MQLLKMAFRNRPIFTKSIWTKQLAPYGINNSQYMFLIKNLSFARYSTRFFVEYVLCSSKQHCTDGCDIGKAGNDYTFSQ